MSARGPPAFAAAVPTPVCDADVADGDRSASPSAPADVVRQRQLQCADLDRRHQGDRSSAAVDVTRTAAIGERQWIAQVYWKSSQRDAPSDLQAAARVERVVPARRPLGFAARDRERGRRSSPLSSVAGRGASPARQRNELDASTTTDVEPPSARGAAERRVGARPSGKHGGEREREQLHHQESLPGNTPAIRRRRKPTGDPRRSRGSS